MSPLSAADEPPAAAAENPTWWLFRWEAQSHISLLRLLLFNPNTKPSTQCRDLKLSLLPQQSLFEVSFLESESLLETLVWVPLPRVLVDPESPVHFKVFDDHIEVKLVLLLPVDHPLVSDFDSILSLEGNPDSLDSDLKKLSRMEEVHFYCRNCSTRLTKGLRCFKEMPSVNWRDVADNWFGNCCCSFGGVSEKLVAEFAKSYTCRPVSSGLSKDIRWIEFSCPQCSCLVGSYPCFDDNVPLDGGVRLFKCYISTCLPVNGSDDAFRNYTLERMFASQLLESAEDELSFRTIVRDMQTKSPVLQIVLLNPNTWVCAGSLGPEEPAAKSVMHPSIKVLFSASGHDVEFDSGTLDDWVRKNQADEIYMFSSQILELIRVLELARSLSPPSYTSLQGLFLSSMRR
ncbi:hypothetical protein OROHE_023234 [Orobanche hederae]